MLLAGLCPPGAERQVGTPPGGTTHDEHEAPHRLRRRLADDVFASLERGFLLSRAAKEVAPLDSSVRVMADLVEADRSMTSATPARIVRAQRAIAAGASRIFELIADPAQQPSWDGNDNLARADPGQRVCRVGAIFATELTMGSIRHNHVTEFDEGRLIAWLPSEPDSDPPGHLWRWQLEPTAAGLTVVTHTYDWSRLTDPARLERARATTADRLAASLAGLAAVAEAPEP